MYQRDKIRNLVREMVLNTDRFLVDVSISQLNKISIAIDSFNGITLDECAKISKAIESRLDRETEDFELEVSSPGLSQPFKVPEQYKKYAGKEVDVVFKNGQKVRGFLKSIASNGIDLEVCRTVRTEKSKKKETISSIEFIEFEKIKHTKLFIKF